MHKHLYNYMVTSQLLTSLQSGFREGNSTTNQFLHIYHTICEAVDKEQYFAILVKHSTESGTKDYFTNCVAWGESGTKDYFTNCVAWGAQIVLSIGLQAIYLSVDNVL